MAAVLQNALFVTVPQLLRRLFRRLPSLAELTRTMSSDALRDGSRYL